MLRVGFYNLAGALVRLGFAAISIPILLRALGADVYGLWSWVLAVLGFVALAEAGLSTATTVLVARAVGRGEARGVTEILTVVIVTVATLASVAGGTLWLLSGWIVAHSDAVAAHQEDAMRALRLGSLVVWTRCLQQVLIAVQQAFGRYGLVNALVSTQAVVSTAGLIVIARQRSDVSALALWLAVSGCLFLLLHLFGCRSLGRGLVLRPAWSSARLGDLLRYSGGAWVVALGTTLFSQGDRLVVGAVLGTAPLGVYAAFTTAALQINVLSAVAVQPLLPELAAGPALGSAALRAKVEQAVRINFALAFSLGLGLAALSPEIARLVLPGEVTTEQVAALRDMGIICALFSVTAVGFYVLQATGRLLTCAAIVLVSSIVTLVLIAVAARGYGLRGAVLGNAGYVLNVALHWTAMSSLGIGWRRWLGAAVLPSLVFAGALLLDAALPASLAARAVLVLAAAGVFAAWALRGASLPGLAGPGGAVS
jgi:O-antigen/teichoic acid export membrane protein